MYDSIGQYQFLSLQGNPEGMRESVEILTRAGVDGQAFWLSGLRSPPFTLRSIVDLPNLYYAVYCFFLYQQLVGADPVNLVWGGIDYSSFGGLVEVVSVRRIRAVATMGVVGGISPPSYGLLEAEWTLVAVPTS